MTEYHRSRVFTTEDVPKKLTGRHDTKKGVWAQVVVERGQVSLTIIDGDTVALTAGQRGVAAPQQAHFVTLAPDSAFYLRFLR